MTFKKWLENQIFLVEICHFQKPVKHSIFGEFTHSGRSQMPALRCDAGTPRGPRVVAGGQCHSTSAPDFWFSALKLFWGKSIFQKYPLLPNLRAFWLENRLIGVKNIKNSKFPKMSSKAILLVPERPQRTLWLFWSNPSTTITTINPVRKARILAKNWGFWEIVDLGLWTPQITHNLHTPGGPKCRPPEVMPVHPEARELLRGVSATPPPRRIFDLAP